MTNTQQKLMIGPRIRRLRQSLGLTQAVMAADLDISTSYMNLIERNQRPMSAKVLLRLADVYEIDISTLSPQSDLRLVRELNEVLKQPAYKEFSISKSEAEDCINTSPDFVKAFLAVHARAEDMTVRTSLIDDPLSDRDNVELRQGGVSAVDSVRVFIHENSNYFDAIDRAAEDLADDLGLATRQPQIALSDRLANEHGIRVRITPADILPGKLSAFDPHSKRLDLSELMPQSGRRFQIAYHIALLEHRHIIDAIIAKASLPSKEAEDLARVSLANYFAAATLMPYKRMLSAAENDGYDVELLSRRFDTSYEQTAHRLTTLHRRGQRGIPFFFVRVDMAGNVSKRFSDGRFHFSRFGGACPLWNIHACFKTPGETLPQIIEMPDGVQYFSVARAVLRPGGSHGERAQMIAIGLGCELKHADRLVYSKSIPMTEPTPIGVNCYVCERQACGSRAHAPIHRKLQFDERSRGQSMFKFED
ncbi:MAG: XRE family transcriptional regulator [Robiginitomaculum sp.]|nr:MAG: XRE family transcriptional regulator [Robiginitomaculum sp.]